MRRPLLGLAVAFGLGCLLTDGESGPAEALVLLALAGSLVALALAAGEERWAHSALSAGALGLGCAAAGIEGLQLEATSLRQVALRAQGGGRARVLGVVRGDAVERRGRLVVSIDADAVEIEGRREACSGRARVEVGGDAPKPRLLDGDRVAVWTSLRPARRAEGVGDGLAAHGYCKSSRLLETSGGDRSVRSAVARLRESARAAIRRSMVPGTEPPGRASAGSGSRPASRSSRR